MANPLKFEIRIGNELQEQINRYKQQLSQLLKNRTITIGVDDKLSAIMQSLIQSFRDINRQQAASVQSLKTMTEYVQQQQKSLSGLAEAQKSVTDASRQTVQSHSANEHAIKAEAEAQKQLNALLKEQEQLKNKISGYKKDIEVDRHILQSFTPEALSQYRSSFREIASKYVQERKKEIERMYNDVFKSLGSAPKVKADGSVYSAVSKAIGFGEDFNIEKLIDKILYGEEKEITAAKQHLHERLQALLGSSDVKKRGFSNKIGEWKNYINDLREQMRSGQSEIGYTKADDPEVYEFLGKLRDRLGKMERAVDEYSEKMKIVRQKYSNALYGFDTANNPYRQNGLGREDVSGIDAHVNDLTQKLKETEAAYAKLQERIQSLKKLAADSSAQHSSAVQSVAKEKSTSVQAIKGETEAQKQLNDLENQRTEAIKRQTTAMNELQQASKKYHEQMLLASNTNEWVQWKASTGGAQGMLQRMWAQLEKDGMDADTELGKYLTSKFNPKNFSFTMENGNSWGLADVISEYRTKTFNALYAAGRAPSTKEEVNVVKAYVEEEVRSMSSIKELQSRLEQYKRILARDESLVQSGMKGYSPLEKADTKGAIEALKFYIKTIEEQIKRLEQLKQKQDAIRQERTSTIKPLMDEYKTSRNEVAAINEQIAAKEKLTQATNQSTEAKNKEAQANERVAATGNAAKNQSAQTSIFDMSAVEKVHNEISGYAKKIDQLIEQIQNSINNMSKGIDVEAFTTKFRQAVQGMVDVLEPFQKALSTLSSYGGEFSNVVPAMVSATTQLASSLKEVSEAQKKSSNTSDSDKESKEKASEGVRDYFNNLVRLERALAQLDAAERSAQKNRGIISASGGDIKSIDEYIEKIKAVKTEIQRLRDTNSGDVLGQKGSMITLPQQLQEALSAILKDSPNVTAEMKEMVSAVAQGKMEVKDLLKLIGESGPLGTKFIQALAGGRDFGQVAKDWESIKAAQDRLASLKTSLSEVSEASMSGDKEAVSLERIRKLLNEINSLQTKLGNVTDASEGVKLLTHDYETLAQRVRDTVNAQNTALVNKEKITARLDPIDQYLSSAHETYDRGAGLKIDPKALSNLDGAISKMESLREEIRGLSNADYLDKAKIQGLLDGYIQLRNTILNAASAVAQLSNKQQSLNDRQTRREESAAKKEAQKQVDSWAKATENLARYDNKLKDAEALLKQVNDVNSRLGKNIDTEKLETYIQYLRNIIRQINEINKNNLIGSAGFGRTNPVGGGRGKLYGQVVGAFEKNQAVAGERAQQEASKALTAALQEERKAQRSAADEASRAAAEQTRLANAMGATTQEAHSQSQVLSDLKGLAMQYFSVYGVQQFITSMAQVTGELELQRRSLEVILGNASAAGEMYTQIKDLSQMSPYTFEDLLKSHRQLAAFGIETDKIFDTLKSLSDIGAGLDVDVSRLILAYGHTRSYGYLSGIQNRQFETAGIDLVGGLAQYYNRLAEAEKKAGKNAEFMTRADIFKKMRARDIPFEDVEQVVLGLDKPGGKFYDMQIKQYDTIGGKIRNLRNNYRIMMSEIGESNHELLAESLNTLNSVMENWNQFARIIKSVAAAFVTLKVSSMLAGQSLVSANSRIARQIVSRNRNAAVNNYLSGNLSMWKAAGAGRGWVHGVRGSMDPNSFEELKNSREYNNLTKQRIALTGNLGIVQRKELLMSTGLNEAAARRIAYMRSANRQLLALRLRIIGAAQAMKAFVVSMLANPMTWIMAITGGITALSSKINDMQDGAKQFGKSLGDSAKSNLEGLRQTLSEYSSLFEERATASTTGHNGDKRIELHYIDLKQAEAETRDLKSLFNDIKTKLQAQSPIYGGDYFNIMKADSQGEQVEEALNTLKRLEYVEKVVAATKDDIETSISQGAPQHWYSFWEYGKGEDLLTNLKDLQDAKQNFVRNFTLSNQAWEAMTEQERSHINRYMEDLRMTRDEAARKYLLERVPGMAQWNESDRTLLQSAQMGDMSESLIGVVQAFADVAPDTEDVKRVSGRLAGAVINNFKDDVKAAVAYITRETNGITANVSDEFSKNISSDSLVQGIVNSIKERTKDLSENEREEWAQYNEDLLASYFGQQLGSKVVEDINERITVKMTKEKGNSIAGGIVDGAIETLNNDSHFFRQWWQDQSEQDKKAYVSQWKKAAYNSAEAITGSAAWQKIAYEAGMNITFTSDADYTEYINKIRKDIKDKGQKLIDNSDKIKYTLGVEVTPELILDKTGLQKFLANIKEKEGAPWSADIKEFFEMIEGAVKESVKDMEYLDSEHQAYSTDKSKSGASEASREHDRLIIKNLQNRQKNLSDAYKTYWDWYERLGKDEQAAMARVREKFTAAQISDEDLRGLKTQEGYISLLNKFIKQVDGEANKLNDKKGNKDTIENIKVSAASTIDQTQQKQFDDAAKKYTSELDLQIKRLEKQYDLYKKIYDLTGNRAMALRLSGRVIRDPSQSKADDVKHAIESNVREVVKQLNLSEINVDFDRVFGLDDEAVTKYIGALFQQNANGNLLDKGTLGTLQPMIDGIVKKLIAWRDLQEQINNENKETYASTVGKMQDYNSVMARNNAAAKDAKDKIDKATDKDGKSLSDKEKQHAKDIIDQETATKNLQATLEYINLINNAIYMGKADFVGNLAKAYADLNSRLAVGTINAADYAREMAKLDKISNDYKNKGLFGVDNRTTAFLQGGIPGLQKWLEKKLEVRRSEIAKELQEQNPEFKKGENKKALNDSVNNLMKNDNEVQKLQKVLDEINLTADKMGDLSTIVSVVVGVFDGLQKAAQELSTMFDALGNESMANFFSDFSDVVGGINSIFTPIDSVLKNAMSGNVGGLVSSVISAPVSMISGPVKAFAQLHDKRRQRKIDKIQEDVSKLAGYAETISKAQQRTLGYDSGDLIRSYQQAYDRNTTSQIQKLYGSLFGEKVGFNVSVMKNTEGAAGIAMSDYYNAAGGGGISGYQQQYDLLVKQRQDYVDMYNLEDSKKKKSKDSLQEYREKIAELDDQIRYFAEDLANTLYGIDLKSWADQIGDALMTAFENGEDAAEAFKDTVTEILQGMVKNMLVVGMIEPLMQELQDELFGYTDSKGNVHEGVFNKENPESSIDAVLSTISEYLGEDGKISKEIPVMETLFNAAEGLVNKNGNNTLLNNNSASMSSSVKGISEQTADLLASYLNAIRADVSVIRQLYGSKAVTYMDSMSLMAQSQVRYQSQIAANTLRSAEAAESILSKQIDIYSLLNAVTNDQKRFTVNAK